MQGKKHRRANLSPEETDTSSKHCLWHSLKPFPWNSWKYTSVLSFTDLLPINIARADFQLIHTAFKSWNRKGHNSFVPFLTTVSQQSPTPLPTSLNTRSTWVAGVKPFAFPSPASRRRRSCLELPRAACQGWLHALQEEGTLLRSRYPTSWTALAA